MHYYTAPPLIWTLFPTCSGPSACNPRFPGEEYPPHCTPYFMLYSEEVAARLASEHRDGTGLQAVTKSTSKVTDSHILYGR